MAFFQETVAIDLAAEALLLARRPFAIGVHVHRPCTLNAFSTACLDLRLVGADVDFEDVLAWAGEHRALLRDKRAEEHLVRVNFFRHVRPPPRVIGSFSAGHRAAAVGRALAAPERLDAAHRVDRQHHGVVRQQVTDVEVSAGNTRAPSRLRADRRGCGPASPVTMSANARTPSASSSRPDRLRLRRLEAEAVDDDQAPSCARDESTERIARRRMRFGRLLP